jgi:hypothetical protein
MNSNTIPSPITQENKMQLIFNLKPEDWKAGRTACFLFDEDILRSCFVAQALKRALPDAEQIYAGSDYLEFTLEGVTYEAATTDELLRQMEIFDRVPIHSSIVKWQREHLFLEIRKDRMNRVHEFMKHELRHLKPTFGTYVVEFTAIPTPDVTVARG